MCCHTASAGNPIEYDGERTVEAIVDFIDSFKYTARTAPPPALPLSQLPAVTVPAATVSRAASESAVEPGVVPAVLQGTKDEEGAFGSDVGDITDIRETPP